MEYAKTNPSANHLLASAIHVVRGSRAFEGTDTFLSVAPGELKSVIRECNTLDNARTPAVEAAGSEPSQEPATED
jgi:hypothetical protein